MCNGKKGPRRICDRTRPSGVVALVAVASLGLAACGGGTQNAVDTAPAQPSNSLTGYRVVRGPVASGNPSRSYVQGSFWLRGDVGQNESAEYFPVTLDLPVGSAFTENQGELTMGGSGDQIYISIQTDVESAQDALQPPQPSDDSGIKTPNETINLDDGVYELKSFSANAAGVTGSNGDDATSDSVDNSFAKLVAPGVVVGVSGGVRNLTTVIHFMLSKASMTSGAPSETLPASADEDQAAASNLR
jgi:hypothetical protein